MPASYRFVRDVTIPDDAEIPAGQTFTKTWRIENNGDVPWGPGFVLSHVNGKAMTPKTNVALPACAPGQQVEVSLDLTAPATTGAHFSDWRLRDASGEFFGDILFTRIMVTPPEPEARAVGQNDAIYIADVTIEDDQEIAPGTIFTKTWRVQNTGNLNWGPGYTFNFEKGTAMTDQTRIPLPPCAPGQECDISITLRAPSEPGTYFGDWNLQDPQGNVFGVLLWFRIMVPEGRRGVERAEGRTDARTEGREAERAGRKPAIQIQAPHFSQRDKRWRAKVLGHAGSPVTIGSWGCLLSCFAMTAGALGYNTTPAELNDTMLRVGGFWQGHFTEWDALSTVYGDLVFEGKEDQHPNIITRIDAHLANQIPVPVLVDRTPRTRYNDNDQHWVLVVARNGDDDYWVYDPADLDAEPISLMDRYGRSDTVLRSAIRSALFYRRR